MGHRNTSNKIRNDYNEIQKQAFDQLSRHIVPHVEVHNPAPETNIIMIVLGVEYGFLLCFSLGNVDPFKNIAKFIQKACPDFPLKSPLVGTLSWAYTRCPLNRHDINVHTCAAVCV